MFFKYKKNEKILLLLLLIYSGSSIAENKIIILENIGSEFKEVTIDGRKGESLLVKTNELDRGSSGTPRFFCRIKGDRYDVKKPIYKVYYRLIACPGTALESAESGRFNFLGSSYYPQEKELTPKSYYGNCSPNEPNIITVKFTPSKDIKAIISCKRG